MRISEYVTLALIVFIALIFTVLISQVIPEKQFEPYTLQLDSVWQKRVGDQEYVVDINHDLLPEFITHHNINQSGHSLEYKHNEQLQTFHIFYKNHFFISTFLHFADINQNRNKEIIFVTAIDSIAWLNIYRGQ